MLSIFFGSSAEKISKAQRLAIIRDIAFISLFSFQKYGFRITLKYREY